MKTGQYDGVSASGDADLRLIYGGDVAPVNTDLVSNYKDISPFLKMTLVQLGRRRRLRHPARLGRQPAHVEPEGGHDRARLVVGGVGQDLAVQGQGDGLRLAHLHRRRRAVPDEDPAEPRDQEPLRPRPDPARRGHGPAQASRRRTSASTGPTTSRPSDAFEKGSLVLGTTWQVIANTINGDQAGSVQTVLPKEGSTAWSDTWMISSKAKHPNCMYLWMNYITSPSVQAQVAEYFGEAPANPKACSAHHRRPDVLHPVPRHRRGVRQASSGTGRRRPRTASTAAARRDCTDYSQWTQAWNDLRAS